MLKRTILPLCVFSYLGLSSSVYADSKNKSKIDTTKGVYLFGDNTNGLISKESKPVIKEPCPVAYFNTKKVTSLAVSPVLAVASLHNGDVVQWTNPENQQIVLKRKNVSKLLVTPKTSNVLALSKNGDIWFWGSESNPEKMKLAEKLGWFEKVTDISCGVNHLAALTNKGRVLTGFVNPKTSTDIDIGETYGQLGLASFPYFEPVKKESLNTLFPVKLLTEKVSQVACGQYHTLFLTNNKSMYGTGSNQHGQLMLPYTFKNMKQNVPVKLSENVGSVAAGAEVTVFSTADPSASWFVAGDGQYGQFGTGSLSNCQITPLKIMKLDNHVEYNEDLHKVTRMAIDTWSIGATHIFARMNNAAEDWFSWGSSEKGQLGTNKLSKLVYPTPVASYMDQLAHTKSLTFVAGDKISGCYYK